MFKNQIVVVVGQFYVYIKNYGIGYIKLVNYMGYDLQSNEIFKNRGGNGVSV